MDQKVERGKALKIVDDPEYRKECFIRETRVERGGVAYRKPCKFKLM